MASWDVSQEEIDKVKKTLEWDKIDWGKYKKMAEQIDAGELEYDTYSTPWEVNAVSEEWTPEYMLNLWKTYYPSRLSGRDLPIEEMPKSFPSTVSPVDIQSVYMSPLKAGEEVKRITPIYDQKLEELRKAREQLDKWHESRKSGATDIYSGKSAKAGEIPLVTKFVELENEIHDLSEKLDPSIEMWTKSDYRKLAPTNVPINTLKYGLGALPIAGALLEPDIASAAVGEVIPGGVDEAGRGSDISNSPQSEFDPRYTDYLKRLRRK